MTPERYCLDPCRASSIPFWKMRESAVPEGMRIIHDEEFDPALTEMYMDEPYFRLKHTLNNLKPVVVPQGYFAGEATLFEFADHINACYCGIGVTAEELKDYTQRMVYCPALWLALRDGNTGQIVATGIGELDRKTGEGILEWIQVSQGYRNRGLGSYLVWELLWRMKDIARFATVSGQCNNPARPERLYRRCGFTGNDIWHILKRKG